MACDVLIFAVQLVKPESLLHAANARYSASKAASLQLQKRLLTHLVDTILHVQRKVDASGRHSLCSTEQSIVKHNMAFSRSILDLCSRLFGWRGRIIQRSASKSESKRILLWHLNGIFEQQRVNAYACVRQWLS